MALLLGPSVPSGCLYVGTGTLKEHELLEVSFVTLGHSVRCEKKSREMKSVNDHT